MTTINDLPDDILARVIAPYCALEERVRMVQTCIHVRRVIMSKRMPLGVDERIEVRDEAMLACITGLITNTIVQKCASMGDPHQG
jgi:hypothetical protein